MYLFADLRGCVGNLDACDIHAVCTDTPGSFSCACNDGFTGNGTSCSGSMYYLFAMHTEFSEFSIHPSTLLAYLRNSLPNGLLKGNIKKIPVESI